MYNGLISIFHEIMFSIDVLGRMSKPLLIVSTVVQLEKYIVDFDATCSVDVQYNYKHIPRNNVFD